MLIRVGDMFLLPRPWLRGDDPEPAVLLAIDPRGLSLTFTSHDEGTFVVPFHAVDDWERVCTAHEEGTDASTSR